MALKPQIGFGEQSRREGPVEALRGSHGINHGKVECVSCARGNERERWSISQPKSQQTVIETQRRMGNRGIWPQNWLSCSRHCDCASSRRKSHSAMCSAAKINKRKYHRVSRLSNHIRVGKNKIRIQQNLLFFFWLKYFSFFIYVFFFKTACSEGHLLNWGCVARSTVTLQEELQGTLDVLFISDQSSVYKEFSKNATKNLCFTCCMYSLCSSFKNMLVLT